MLPPEQHKHTHNWDHLFCNLLFYSTVNILYIPFLELYVFHCKDISQFNNQSYIFRSSAIICYYFDEMSILVETSLCPSIIMSVDKYLDMELIVHRIEELRFLIHIAKVSPETLHASFRVSISQHY